MVIALKQSSPSLQWLLMGFYLSYFTHSVFLGVVAFPSLVKALQEATTLQMLFKADLFFDKKLLLHPLKYFSRLFLSSDFFIYSFVQIFLGPVSIWGWFSSFREFIPGHPDPVFSSRLKKVSLVRWAGSDIWCPACARMPLPHSGVGFWHFHLILHTHT